MDVLIAEAIPLWLDDIQASRLSPEKRELILVLQEKVVDTLHRHFSRTEPAPPPSPQRERPTISSDAPAQMIAEAMQAMGEAAHLIVGAAQTVGEAFQWLAAEHQATMQETQQIIGVHLTTLDERQAAFEETQRAMGEQMAETSERQATYAETQQAIGKRLTTLEGQCEVTQEWQHALGDYLVETREQVTALEQHMRDTPDTSAGDAPPAEGPLLTPQQLAQVYALARKERGRSGMPVSAQLAALAEAFGVADVSDLPDAAWNDVLGWFWQQRRRD